MNYYPDEVIEEVRLNNDLVEVVSEYVRLEKKGGGYLDYALFIMKRHRLFMWSL